MIRTLTWRFKSQMFDIRWFENKATKATKNYKYVFRMLLGRDKRKFLFLIPNDELSSKRCINSKSQHIVGFFNNSMLSSKRCIVKFRVSEHCCIF